MSQASGKGGASDAKAKTEPNSPDRPDSVPKSYVWDPELGPRDDKGNPSGAWREPTDKDAK